MGKRELIALLNLSSWCLVMVERLFLAVPRGCLQFVIVVFPDHTHLLFLRWFFTVKKTYANSLIAFDLYYHFKKLQKKISKICLILILQFEFIDTETITMYKKLRCERHRYIFYFYGI